MGCVIWIGSVVKAAVGQGAAEALVEEQKQERHLNAFGGEPVGIAGAIALQQTVALQFAQVVPMKLATSRTRLPSTMDGSSASVNWCYFPPIPEMPGCSMSPIRWPPHWLGMAILNPSIWRRLTPASPSGGRGAITSKGLPSCIQTVIRDGSEPSSGILRRRLRERVSSKISNMFG